MQLAAESLFPVKEYINKSITPKPKESILSIYLFINEAGG
jgi:hypothetical protein